MFNVICKYSIAIQAALCHIFNFEKFHKQQKSLKTSPKYKQVRQWRVGRVDNLPTQVLAVSGSGGAPHYCLPSQL